MHRIANSMQWTTETDILFFNFFADERKKRQTIYCETVDGCGLWPEPSFCAAMEETQHFLRRFGLSQNRQTYCACGGQLPALAHFQGAASQEIP